MLKKTMSLLMLLGVAACGPNFHHEGLGTKLSQEQITEELVGRHIRFSGRGSIDYFMELREDGAISVTRPQDSGEWRFSEGTTDICMQFVFYALGDEGCFGISKLQEEGHFATDHGFLITITPFPVVLVSANQEN